MIAADQLRLFIERIERLEEEKQALADDIKDVYSEAKSNGYDTRTMREVVKLQKLETHVRQEREALLETYCNALGLTPLESYAAHLRDADERGIGVSIQVAGEPAVHMNETARAKAEAA